MRVTIVTDFEPTRACARVSAGGVAALGLPMPGEARAKSSSGHMSPLTTRNGSSPEQSRAPGIAPAAPRGTGCAAVVGSGESRSAALQALGRACVVMIAALDDRRSTPPRRAHQTSRSPGGRSRTAARGLAPGLGERPMRVPSRPRAHSTLTAPHAHAQEPRPAAGESRGRPEASEGAEHRHRPPAPRDGTAGIESNLLLYEHRW